MSFLDDLPDYGATQQQAAAPSQAKSGSSFLDQLPDYGSSAGNGVSVDPATGRLRIQMGNPPAQDQPQQPSPTLGDYAADFAKSLGIGGVQGAVDLAGLPADLTNVATKGIDYLAGTNTNDTVQPFVNTLGSQALQKDLEDQTAPFYQPKYLPGKFGQAIGQFASAALSGPESIALRLGTRVLAPAIASEGAGQIADNIAPEIAPFARIGAAIAGAGLASGLANASVKAALTKAPTEPELEASKNALYASPEIAGLQFRPQAMTAFSNAVKRLLLNNKVDADLAPTVSKIVAGLQSPRFGPAGTVSDFDLARQSLSDVPPAEKRAAGIVRGAIDNYLGNVPQGHLLAGDARAANARLVQARKETAALKRSQDITSAMGRAENQAGATHSGQNLENATRQQLKPILNEKQGFSKKKTVFKDYTDEEIAALKKAVNGSHAGNAVRAVGKLLGSGHGVGGAVLGVEAARQAHDAGYDWLTSGLIGAGTLAAGKATSKLGAHLETQRAKEIGDLLRSRSPSGEAGAARNRGLLAKYGSKQTIPNLGYQGLLGALPALRAEKAR